MIEARYRTAGGAILSVVASGPDISGHVSYGWTCPGCKTPAPHSVDRAAALATAQNHAQACHALDPQDAR